MNKKRNSYFSDFKMYNKCLISNLAPNEVPDITDISRQLNESKCLLARYTDHFDKSLNNN